MEATSPVNCIEGGVLVDLCMQRSGKRGSGCNALNEADRFPTSADGSFKSSEGLPTPETSPLRPPKPPRTKIRQYSWRNSSKREVCMYIRMLKPLEIRKEKEELTFKSQESTNCPNHQEAESRHPGSTNYDDIECEVMVSGIIVAGNGDVTTRPDVNRLIARKRYVPRKRSLMHSVGSFERSLRACSRTVTFIALLLAIVINVLGGLINIRLYERKSTIGNSSSLTLSRPLSANSCRELLFLYLRELSATILVINKELWPCLMIETNWNANKRLKRRREVLHNTRIRDEGGYGHTGYSHRPPGCHGYSMCIMQSLARTFLAGKRLGTYIFLFADFWASSVFYLDAYTVNLELNDNLKVFYDRIYLYIYTMFTVLGYPTTGQHTLRLFQLKRILWFIFPQKLFF